MQCSNIGIKWAHVPTCFSDYLKHSYSKLGVLLHGYTMYEFIKFTNR